MNGMKFYIVLIIVLFSSCVYDPIDKRLLVVNHQTNDIVIYWNSDTIPEFPSVNHTEVYLTNYGIRSNDSLWVPEDGANWPKYLDSAINKRLNLFVYNVDTIKKYNNIDTINIKKRYQRLEYSKQQLEKLNWRIVVKGAY